MMDRRNEIIPTGGWEAGHQWGPITLGWEEMEEDRRNAPLTKYLENDNQHIERHLTQEITALEIRKGKKPRNEKIGRR